MRGWRATVAGRIRTEEDSRWLDLEVAGVTELCLEWDGRFYGLPAGKKGYFQSKTASAPIGGGLGQIVSRQIGWVEGGLRITLRVFEKDGYAKVETTPVALQESGSAVRGSDVEKRQGGSGGLA